MLVPLAAAERVLLEKFALHVHTLTWVYAAGDRLDCLVERCVGPSVLLSRAVILVQAEQRAESPAPGPRRDPAVQDRACLRRRPRRRLAILARLSSISTAIATKQIGNSGAM